MNCGSGANDVGSSQLTGTRHSVTRHSVNSIKTDRLLENSINKSARSPGLGGLGSDEVREGLWDAIEHIWGNLHRSMKSSKFLLWQLWLRARFRFDFPTLHASSNINYFWTENMWRKLFKNPTEQFKLMVATAKSMKPKHVGCIEDTRSDKMPAIQPRACYQITCQIYSSHVSYGCFYIGPACDLHVTRACRHTYWPASPCHCPRQECHMWEDTKHSARFGVWRKPAALH